MMLPENLMTFIFILFMSNHINPDTVFIIIPAYNEHAVIEKVISELLLLNYKIVLVDDGSKEEISFPANKQAFYLLRHRVNLGQGAALQTGIEFALTRPCDYIVTFDADGQHQPGDIENLVQTLISTKSDIVLGSRFMAEKKSAMPFTRKLVLQTARYLNYLFTGLLLTDAHNGLRAMTRNAAQKIEIQENRMSHATEILSQIKKAKLHYTEASVNIRYTPYSIKKGQTTWSSFRIFFDILLNKIFK